MGCPSGVRRRSFFPIPLSLHCYKYGYKPIPRDALEKDKHNILDLLEKNDPLLIVFTTLELSA